MISSPMLDAIDRFRGAVRGWLGDPNTGTRYALEMAAEELRLLGLNPEWVTPDGYEDPRKGPDR